MEIILLMNLKFRALLKYRIFGYLIVKDYYTMILILYRSIVFNCALFSVVARIVGISNKCSGGEEYKNP